MSQHQTKITYLLREIVAYCREAGHEWSSLAEAEAALSATQPAQAAQGGPLPEHADHVPEIAARLRLVARLAGCADAIPEDDRTAVGCIFSVLGNMRRALELKQAAQGEPDGMVPAPHYRGYAVLGIGEYLINHTPAGDPAELVISIASDADKDGRVVGDERDNLPGAMIQPEQMAVRVRFENVAGLDALEGQLRYVRGVHFPGSIKHPAVAQGAGEVVRDYYQELLTARGAVQELEQKVFSQEQAIAILHTCVASHQRDMADPPAYLQDAVIKAAGLGAMAEQIAELKRQATHTPTQPAAGADVVPEHVALLNEKVQELEARDAFEARNKCSLGFKRSARGTYVNPPVARDWKWFQLGIQHANKDAS